MSSQRGREIWYQCPDDQLSDHFWKMSEYSNPDRKDCYDLLESPDFKIADFNGEQIQISLTLTNTIPSDEKATFRPIIELDKEGVYFPIEEKVGGGVAVDRAYKRRCREEWRGIEHNEIYSVFRRTVLCCSCGAMKYRRILSYKINNVINNGLYEALVTKKKEIDEVIFYMGVNNANVNEENKFRFTPVIGLDLGRALSTEEQKFFEKLGFVYEIEVPNEVFYQELHPCPPFGGCND